MTLTLPLPPNMADTSMSRRHWAVRYKAQQQYWDMCTLWRINENQPRPERQPPQTADVMVTLYLHQRMDDDNAAARCKWLLDWLVRNGYLWDDSQQHCRLTVCQQIDRRRQRACVEITP